MAVTMALFTRDLRVHDNPVLGAAAKNGDAVLPVFVVDEAIAAGSYLTPNKARFLAAALAELDDELRAAFGTRCGAGLSGSDRRSPASHRSGANRWQQLSFGVGGFGRPWPDLI